MDTYVCVALKVGQMMVQWKIWILGALLGSACPASSKFYNIDPVNSRVRKKRQIWPRESNLYL
jgi:hypothetical protein